MSRAFAVQRISPWRFRTSRRALAGRDERRSAPVVNPRMRTGLRTGLRTGARGLVYVARLLHLRGI